MMITAATPKKPKEPPTQTELEKLWELMTKHVESHGRSENDLAEALRLVSYR